VNGTAGETICVLGLGEAGSLLAKDLIARGARVVGWDPWPHGDIAAIPFAASFAEAVRGARVVMSVNWARVAEAVARNAAPLVGTNTIYADFNTSGAALKRSLAEIIAPTGARFVDIAIMAPVPGLGIRVPALAAGPGAQAFVDRFTRFGMPVQVVDGPPGSAAARKMVRSVYWKGMAAAVNESLEAARAAGIEDWIRADIAATFEQANTALVDRLEKGSRQHAVRRGHEMREVVATLSELGVPSRVSLAAAESLERMAEQNAAKAT